VLNAYTADCSFMTAPARRSSLPDPEYTIDELAAHAGVPSRTIRFYQARGVLPPPRKRGRVAVYGEAHAERLRAVSALQGKGLRLQAIRDVVSVADREAEAVRKWFGVPSQSVTDDLPRVLTEEELKLHLGDPSAGAIGRLIRRGAIERQGQAGERRYYVHPSLLLLAKRLSDAGVDLETALRLQEILERRFARAAREVVGCAIDKLRHHLSRGSKREGAMLTLETLFGDGGIGEEAMRLIFSREIQRAVEAALRPSGAAAESRPPHR
jgi:DNA-binding transcriptional MerR regulator